MKFLEGRRGLTGISALIIFIAVVLIAAMSAILLINYGGNLQQSAIKVKQESEGASMVKVDYIVGLDGSAGKDLERFEVIMRLEAGSNDLRFNDTIILVETYTTSQTIHYNMSAGDTSNAAATTADYTVEWIRTSSDHEVGYLKRGEIVKVRFNHYCCGPSDTTGGVSENKKLDITVIPRLGNPTPTYLITPKTINEQRKPLYPKDGLL